MEVFLNELRVLRELEAHPNVLALEAAGGVDEVLPADWSGFTARLQQALPKRSS